MFDPKEIEEFEVDDHIDPDPGLLEDQQTVLKGKRQQRKEIILQMLCGEIIVECVTLIRT
jgi:hypothetical protein